MSNIYDAMRAAFQKDRFAAANGIELIEIRSGYAKAKMTVEDRHLNGLDIVQGGAIFTLADVAFAGACNSVGQVAVSVNATLSFLKPTRSGTLWAEAHEISRSRRLSNCTVRVTDDADKLVAMFQGVAYVKEKSFP